MFSAAVMLVSRCCFLWISIPSVTTFFYQVYIVRAYDSEDNEDQENTKDNEVKDNIEDEEDEGKIEENGKVSDATDLNRRYPKRIRASKYCFQPFITFSKSKSLDNPFGEGAT